MIDAAKAVTKKWANEFIERFGVVRDTTHLRELIDRTNKDGTTFDRMMVQMPFDEFATVVIHHTSKQIAAQKVREVSVMAAKQVTRREYWNKLDRAHHFVAGAIAMQASMEESGLGE